MFDTSTLPQFNKNAEEIFRKVANKASDLPHDHAVELDVLIWTHVLRFKSESGNTSLESNAAAVIRQVAGRGSNLDRGHAKDADAAMTSQTPDLGLVLV